MGYAPPYQLVRIPRTTAMVYATALEGAPLKTVEHAVMEWIVSPDFALMACVAILVALGSVNVVM